MKFGIMMSLSLTQCRELYVLPQLHPPVRLPNQCLFPAMYAILYRANE